MLPTLALGTEVLLRDDPLAAHAAFRAFNRPLYDRLRATAADAEVLVAYHAADSGYACQAAEWGERTHFQGYKDSPFTEILSLHIERPIFDTLAALVAHGLFDRHPTLRVSTVEPGSGWVRELLRRMAIRYRKIPQAFHRDPIESFREHVWVTPFQEDHLSELVELIGADHILFGSDWPPSRRHGRTTRFPGRTQRHRPRRRRPDRGRKPWPSTSALLTLAQSEVRAATPQLIDGRPS